METIFMNTENRKMNEPHKLVLNLSQSSNKHVIHVAKCIYLLHMEKYKKTV